MVTSFVHGVNCKWSFVMSPKLVLYARLATPNTLECSSLGTSLSNGFVMYRMAGRLSAGKFPCFVYGGGISETRPALLLFSTFGSSNGRRRSCSGASVRLTDVLSCIESVVASWDVPDVDWASILAPCRCKTSNINGNFTSRRARRRRRRRRSRNRVSAPTNRMINSTVITSALTSSSLVTCQI
jgi:hypothetical protein